MSTNLKNAVVQLITTQCENKTSITSWFYSFVHFPFYFRTPVFQHRASLVFIYSKKIAALGSRAHFSYY